MWGPFLTFLIVGFIREALIGKLKLLDMIRTDCFKVVQISLQPKFSFDSTVCDASSEAKIFDYRTTDVLAELHPPRARATLPSSS